MPSDWDARTYDRISDPQARWAADVVGRIDPDGVRTILDAGCGSGRVTEMLLVRFPDSRVVAVDVSETMLAEARSRLAPFAGRITFLRSDLLQPLATGGPVDAVFSNAVFHWIGDHDRLFRNLAAALRGGGQLVAQWGGTGNVERLMSVAQEVAPVSAAPANFATAEETAARLAAAVFRDVRTWVHPAPADFATREEFECYLRTICLRVHLDLLDPGERDRFIGAVADRLPDRRVDYVRLNATARRVG